MKSSKNQFQYGESVQIKATGELVTIMKWEYVKNMKRYSYVVKQHPGTFFFEEELQLTTA
ncbi:hypothetical protein AB1K84_17425 [Mesobacillus foraminis]|uniref:Uncharacterized protein n=1 Tax=Mesobacillus foraminis TaxID=279826 RepID=A0A4R2B7X6_9BACI|nr:hypothetical protein [Mesobacillus foraminis]MBT2758894.1 hypothetical protein [Mesobacillus foraminis]TCN21504.1 hypothetical protein EV146_112187 [Mesobacillus foraminis]